MQTRKRAWRKEYLNTNKNNQVIPDSLLNIIFKNAANNLCIYIEELFATFSLV